MHTTFRKLTAAERQLLAVALARGTPVSTAGFKIDAETKPSVNWDHVAKQYKYLTRDANHKGFLYTDRPYEGAEFWSCTGDIVSAEQFASYKPGDCDWRESLIVRPGAEE